MASTLWLHTMDRSQEWTSRINPAKNKDPKTLSRVIPFEPYIWTQCVPDADFSDRMFHDGAGHRGHLYAEGQEYNPACWEDEAQEGCALPNRHCRGCRLPLHPVISNFATYFFQASWTATADDVAAFLGAKELRPSISVRATKRLKRHLHSTHNRGPMHWLPWVEMFDWLLLQWNPGLYKLVDSHMFTSILRGFPSAKSLPYVGAFLVRQRQEPRSIFMPAQLVPYFVRDLLGRAPTPGLAVYIGRGWEDAFVPRRWLRYLVKHPKVIHLFVENPRLRHPKITAMPIGMDPHFLAEQSGQALADIASNVRLEDKIVDRLAGGWAIIGHHRVAATDFMSQRSWCDWVHTDGAYGHRNIEYWKRVSRYAFVLSPPAAYLGSGPRGPIGDGDSYRTFEALVLGTIPILVDSQNSKAWDGLPVVKVKNWTEITPERLKVWWREKKPLLEFSRPYLHSSFWWKKIETALNRSGYWS